MLTLSLQLEQLRQIVQEEFIVFGNSVAERFHESTQREMNPMDLFTKATESQ